MCASLRPSLAFEIPGRRSLPAVPKHLTGLPVSPLLCGESMNASNHLFDFHPDWLAHTLASAFSDLPETKRQLPDGTQVSRKANGVLWLTPPAGREDVNNEALIVSAGAHGNETAPRSEERRVGKECRSV